MKIIELTQGRVALVDDADYDFLVQWKWCAVRCGRNWYATTRTSPTKHTLMHRMLLPNSEMVDHIDHDGLNNQRSNLRPANPGQNRMNSRKLAAGTSRYKGVSRVWGRDLWQAAVMSKVEGKRQFVFRKFFKAEIEAARAYNENALKHFGEFAALNDLAARTDETRRGTAWSA